MEGANLFAEKGSSGSEAPLVSTRRETDTFLHVDLPTIITKVSAAFDNRSGVTSDVYNCPDSKGGPDLRDGEYSAICSLCSPASRVQSRVHRGWVCITMPTRCTSCFRLRWNVMPKDAVGERRKEAQLQKMEAGFRR